NDLQTLLLVNDLDLRISKDGVTYYPWTLNPSVPTDAAERDKDNFRDNFEKIEIDLPIEGFYTIQVTHKGSLTGNQQPFSLIVSGIDQRLNAPSFELDGFQIFPNPTKDSFFVSLADNFEDKTIEVFDIHGRLLVTKKSNDPLYEIQ